MTNTDIYEGVFAIRKPVDVTSAAVLERLKGYFRHSTLFAPWIAEESARREEEFRRSNSRNKYKKKRKTPDVKMGHGGTLDPAAEGVLIVGVGRGTKCLSRFLACTKHYDAMVLFGCATDTYDREGKVLGTAPAAHISSDLVREKLRSFRGDIMQKPPVYSALNVKGKRLYEYAREGLEIPEIPSRPVEVIDIELKEWFEAGQHEWRYPKTEAEPEEKEAAKKVLDIPTAAPEVTSKKRKRDSPEAEVKKLKTEHTTTEVEDEVAAPQPITSPTEPEPIPSEATMSGALQIDTDLTKPEDGPEPTEKPPTEAPPAPAARVTMTVSSGFYVRSLCYDLGKACESLAFMASLVRTRQGDFELGKNVMEMDEFEAGEETWAPKLKEMLRTWMFKEGWINEDDPRSAGLAEADEMKS